MTLVSHYRDSFTEGKVQRISIRRSMTFDKVFFHCWHQCLKWKEKSKYFIFWKKKLNLIKQQTPISLWTDFCNIFSFFQIQNVIFFSLETINLKQFTAAAGRTTLFFLWNVHFVIRKIVLKTEKFWAKKVMIESLKVKTKFKRKGKMDWKVIFRFCLVLSQLVFPFSVFHWIIIIVFNHIFPNVFFQCCWKDFFCQNSIFFIRTMMSYHHRFKISPKYTHSVITLDVNNIAHYRNSIGNLSWNWESSEHFCVSSE